MAHSTGTLVKNILGIGTTEYQRYSSLLSTCIDNADEIIDSKLARTGLTVTGTSSDLVTMSSKYLAAALYLEMRAEQRGTESMSAKQFRATSRESLDTYIREQGEHMDPDKGGRLRNMYSTHYPNP